MMFVDAMNGKKVSVTVANHVEAALLCKEFGYHGLDRDIAVVGPGVKKVHRSLVTGHRRY